jgi:hypothetical protein
LTLLRIIIIIASFGFFDILIRANEKLHLFDKIFDSYAVTFVFCNLEIPKAIIFHFQIR